VKTLPPVDVAIVGGGWAGLLMAKELGARTGLSIVVLEQPRLQPCRQQRKEQSGLGGIPFAAHSTAAVPGPPTAVHWRVCSRLVPSSSPVLTGRREEIEAAHRTTPTCGAIECSSISGTRSFI